MKHFQESLLFIIIYLLKIFSSSIVEVSQFERCNPKEELKIDLTVLERMKGDDQQIKLNATLTVDVGNDNEGSIRLFRVLGQKKKFLTALPIKGICKALSEYGTSAYYNAAKIIGIDPTKCPIPKNKYYLDWYTLDYNAITLIPMVPKGKYYVQLQSKGLVCLGFHVKKN